MRVLFVGDDPQALELLRATMVALGVGCPAVGPRTCERGRSPLGVAAVLCYPPDRRHAVESFPQDKISAGTSHR